MFLLFLLKPYNFVSILTSWIKDGIKEISQKQENIKTNKKEVLQKEYARVQGKLNNLYNLQLEGKASREMFYIKER